MDVKIRKAEISHGGLTQRSRRQHLARVPGPHLATLRQERDRAQRLLEAGVE